MALGVLEAVDQRTKIVGRNRLELLLFQLNGPQIYGINVFKVREVLQCPKLTLLPHRDPMVCGIAHIRGQTISVLDVSLAVGNPPLENPENHFVIVSEYNRTVQGFLVESVKRIVNLNWDQVHTPPKGSGQQHFLTAVTHVDDKIIQILDVEKILSNIIPPAQFDLEQMTSLPNWSISENKALRIMVVDDSSVARKQISRCLDALGFQVDLLTDGSLALKHLQTMLDNGVKPSDHYLMIISDIEMPEMDGYTFTSSIRQNPGLADLYLILHSSLTGIFNQEMVKQAGANDFLSKFKPEDFAERVLTYVRKKHG
ncbi:MAG: chemotaxis protein CheV [Pseudomonadota bacterium]